MTDRNDQDWMDRALTLASHAAAQGEVPVGAVVVSADNQLLGEGWNQPISSHDPTAHAEILALRAAAAKVGNYRLPGATLYVTIEPCAMCAGALVHSRVARVVFGATEPKAGAAVSQLQLFDADFVNHRVQCESGVRGEEAAQLIAQFFQGRRLAKKTARDSEGGEQD